MYNLNNLIPGGSGVNNIQIVSDTRQFGRHINDWGQIAANGSVTGQGSRALRLDPASPLTSTSGGGAARNTKFVAGMAYSQFTATINPNNLGTAVDLLGGTVGSGGPETYGLNRDVDIAFSPPNPLLPVSDAVTLTGTEGDTFTLQLSYDESAANSLLGGEANARLGWLNGANWVLAVDGNSGGTPNFVAGPWNASYALGSHGVDVATNTVWAVINHNSDFAVIRAGLPGDYNDDGAVDAADYVVWRKLEGTTTVLPNDPDGGTIGANQYNTWRTHFGQTAGSGTSAGDDFAAPEPTTVSMLLGIVAVLTRSRATQRQRQAGSTPSRNRHDNAKIM
jgi:hypothetical protein